MSLGSTIDIGIGGIRVATLAFDKTTQQLLQQEFDLPGESVTRSDAGGATPPTASASRPVDQPRGAELAGMAETIVRLEQHARDVQTAAKVVQAADTVLGALLGDNR